VRLLVIEDDRKIASFIKRGLSQEYHAVDIALDGEDGASLAEDPAYDLVILDMMLPKLSGMQVLCRIREKQKQLPVLILTAKDSVQDIVAALDAGADDYLRKPFQFSELTARVRALLRRGDRSVATYQVADLTLDPARRAVTRAGQKIDLSAKEFALLEYLLQNAGKPVTRTSIVEHVWDMHFETFTNVVEVYVNYLRNKIDKQFSPPLIHTVRGVGYMLTDETNAAA
jgi:two-component system, OmpR family, copper resistance phosphate regulon response regulator CusR